MTAAEKISQFIESRLQQLQAESSREQDLGERLNTSAMRISFANIMNVFLGKKEELGGSYLSHAQVHFDASSHQQAIFHAQLAKKHLKEPSQIEQADLLILRSLLKLDRDDEAGELLEAEEETQLSSQKLAIKARVMQKIGKEAECDRIMDKLQATTKEKHSERSSEMGLLLVERGQQKAAFGRASQALAYMQTGMDILVAVLHQDKAKISSVYRQMASLNRQLADLESQYSSLICAYSMLRQCPDSERDIVDVLHCIIRNQLQQENNEAALKELLKVQVLQKRIYGESSGAVGRTLKKISKVMDKLGRRNDAKRYQLEHSRIANCNEKKGMSRDKPLRYSQVRLH